MRGQSFKRLLARLPTRIYQCLLDRIRLYVPPEPCVVLLIPVLKHSQLIQGYPPSRWCRIAVTATASALSS